MGKVERFTEEQIIEAIKDSAGVVTTISKSLNCSWHTAKRAIDRTDATKEAYTGECERVLDIAENELLKKIEGGDPQMIKYLLSTKGKRRGFTEKTEVDLGGEINLNINVQSD